MIHRVLRPTIGFMFRDYHLYRRYFSWIIVEVFYSMVTAATISLIGIAAGDYKLTLTLTLGALLWSFLSTMFFEIANSISYERWEGTLEYTFMAPVSRLSHLAGISTFAIVYAILRMILVMGALLLIIPIRTGGANLAGVLLVMVIGSCAFVGLGLMAAVFPLMSPEHGAQATNIFQGLLLLVSGVYYPVGVLPVWIQPLSALSPATYALSAGRKLLGVDNPHSKPDALIASSMWDVLPELWALAAMGVILIPAGLLVFHRAEIWAKKHGKLKRTG